MEQRLKVEDLLRLLVILDKRLLDDNADVDDYEREWAATLEAAGYTLKEYEQIIDDRWDDPHALTALTSQPPTLN